MILMNGGYNYNTLRNTAINNNIAVSSSPLFHSVRESIDSFNLVISN